MINLEPWFRFALLPAINMLYTNCRLFQNQFACRQGIQIEHFNTMLLLGQSVIVGVSSKSNRPNRLKFTINGSLSGSNDVKLNHHYYIEKDSDQQELRSLPLATNLLFSRLLIAVKSFEGLWYSLVLSPTQAYRLLVRGDINISTCKNESISWDPSWTRLVKVPIED